MHSLSHARRLAFTPVHRHEEPVWRPEQTKPSGDEKGQA